MDFEIEGEDDAYNFDMWQKPSKSKNFFSGGDDDAVYNYDFRSDVVEPMYALDSPVVSKKKKADTSKSKSKPQAQTAKSASDASNIMDKAKSLMSKYSKPSNPVRASAPTKPSAFDDFDEDDISIESSSSVPKSLTRTSGQNMKQKQAFHKASKGSYDFDESPALAHVTSALDLENDDISETSLPKETSEFSVDKSQISGNESYSNDDFDDYDKNGEDSMLSDSAVVEHHHHHHHKPAAPAPVASPPPVADEPEKLNLHTIDDLLGDAGWDISEDVHQSFVEESIPDTTPVEPQEAKHSVVSRAHSAASDTSGRSNTTSAIVSSVSNSMIPPPAASEPTVRVPQNHIRAPSPEPSQAAPVRHEEPVIKPTHIALQSTITRQISPHIDYVSPKPSDSIAYPTVPEEANMYQQSKEFVRQFQHAVQSETIKYSQAPPASPPIHQQSQPSPQIQHHYPPQQQQHQQPPPQLQQHHYPPQQQHQQPPPQLQQHHYPPQQQQYQQPPPPPQHYPQYPQQAAPQFSQQPYAASTQHSQQIPPQMPPPYSSPLYYSQQLPYCPPNPYNYPYIPPMHSYPPPQNPYSFPMPAYQRPEQNSEYEKKIEALMSELTFAKEEAAFATRKLADVIIRMQQQDTKSTVSTSTEDLPKNSKQKNALMQASSSNSFEDYEDDFEESQIAPPAPSPSKTRQDKTEKQEVPKINISVSDEIPKRVSSESPRYHISSTARSSEYLPRRSVRYDFGAYRDSASSLLFTSQEIFRRQLDTLRSKLDVMNASRNEMRSEYRPYAAHSSVSALDDLKKNFDYRRKTTQAKLKDALLQVDPSLSMSDLNNLLAKYG